MPIHDSSGILQERLRAEDFQSITRGKTTGLYFITNGNGYTAITNYGARVVGLWVPGKSGQLVDVVVGMGNLKQYLETPDPYYGALSAGMHY